ncbi:MAG TPA: DUF1385 domain-containing protein [Polyangiaceae bacterium]
MTKAEQRPYIGGQAVIEGVMMRSPLSFAIVVRRASGELLVRERPVHRVVEKAPSPVRKWPFVRGVATLIEAIGLGSEALRFSSEIYERDHLDDAPPGSGSSRSLGGRGLQSLAFWMAALATHEPDPGSPPPASGAEPDAGRRLLSGVTLLFGIGLFVVLPQAAAALVNRSAGLSLDLRSPYFQALTGMFKLAIVVGYLLLIRRIPEIRRVFQYHGAEHKTISTYEAQEPLLVANARAKTTLHPRCGTTFIVMVALVSIFAFTAIAPLLPRLPVSGFVENVMLILLKLPFLLPIAAVTFEIQRVFARYCARGPLRALLWPGFLVQKITTIEPDDSQLEVALSALRTTLWREQASVAAPVASTDRTFLDFDALSADPGYGRAA